jgi:dTDP-4-dehydrorhamnose reductase
MMADEGQTQNALITGAGGLLGRYMTAHLRELGWHVTALTHPQLDITDEEAVQRSLTTAQPDYVINCVATGNVDLCETEPDWAFAVNESGPRYLARACHEIGAELIHISTDYVFDGTKEGLYTQEDEAHPLSVYGKSKLAGERAVFDELATAYVIRTSWLFGAEGKNFGSRIIEQARAGVKLKGVTDQTSIATYAKDFAARIEEIIERKTYGLYQVTNTGVMTWYEFGKLALELAGLGDYELEPVSRLDLKQLAPRPKNSAMRCLLSEQIGLPPLRHWRDALTEFVRENYLNPGA